MEDPAGIRRFDRLGYGFREDLSSDREYVFERKGPVSAKAESTGPF